MGYEVAEQLGWTLPDAIIYPTGGGVGLIGMWKAFDEMEQLGWIGTQAPEDDCRAGRRAARRSSRPGKKAKPRPSRGRTPHTFAAGLRVPKAYGDYIILDILRKSGGTAVAVTDDEIMDGVRDLGARRRHLRRARRRRRAGRATTQLLRSRLPQAERHGRALQHRLRA